MELFLRLEGSWHMSAFAADSLNQNCGLFFRFQGPHTWTHDKSLFYHL